MGCQNIDHKESRTADRRIRYRESWRVWMIWELGVLFVGRARRCVAKIMFLLRLKKQNMKNMEERNRTAAKRKILAPGTGRAPQHLSARSFPRSLGFDRPVS